MIEFEGFVLEEGTPIYQQILMYLKRGIAAGTIRDGDELPSRRMLSALLGVNPNTVQKAYRQLEEEGLIQSRTGAKSCVAVQNTTVQTVGSELLQSDIKAVIRAMKQSGVSREDALQLLSDLWEVEE